MNRAAAEPYTLRIGPNDSLTELERSRGQCGPQGDPAHDPARPNARMAAKRHHTVPRFFLRRFAAENGLLRVVERDDFSKWFETGVENALAQTHFYSIDTEEGPNTGVEEERRAKTVEGPAARALRRIVDEGVFPPMAGLRKALCTFFAFQFVRGEGKRAALLERYEALATCRPLLPLGFELLRVRPGLEDGSRNERSRRDRARPRRRTCPTSRARKLGLSELGRARLASYVDVATLAAWLERRDCNLGGRGVRARRRSLSRFVRAGGCPLPSQPNLVIGEVRHEAWRRPIT